MNSLMVVIPLHSPGKDKASEIEYGNHTSVSENKPVFVAFCPFFLAASQNGLWNEDKSLTIAKCNWLA